MQKPCARRKDPGEEYLTRTALHIQSCDGCQQNWLSQFELKLEPVLNLELNLEPLLIPGRTAGQEVCFLRSISGFGSMEGPFQCFHARCLRRKLLQCEKSGCRTPGQAVLQLFSAGARQPPQKWACKSNECDQQWHLSTNIVCDIVHDIECNMTTISKLQTTISYFRIDLQYWIRYRS